MCARILLDGSIYQPGARIKVETPEGRRDLLWGGERVPPFARAETLHEKWLSRGWTQCLIPAANYAERHGATHQLVWAPSPANYALHGLCKGDVVVVVTRAANERELAYFGHPRHPEIASGPTL